MLNKRIIQKMIISFLLQVFSLGYSQQVEVVEKGMAENLSPKEFMIPLKNAENYTSVLVNRYKAYSQNAYVGHLFSAIANDAKKDGANAYSIISYKKGDKQSDSELILDTYSLNDSEVERMSELLEKNTVYIFGGPSVSNDTASKFKINGDKKEVKNNTFFRAIVKENEELKIVKGGITGMAVWIKWKLEQFNRFFSFSGLGVDGVGISGNGMGVGFNTGRINPVDRDLGYFLIQVLKESQ
ncbi:hypothetical protein SAMN05421768_102434 [Chryseobacterium joostei]|uniref:Uncharacterized protein n=2 Tax=Chryseobacterium joostei TaxID=112234 RepID=A0A1N7I3G2_9FLAO|nr:hypothetical protein SAMN05421768_102434 [Chryseobacterium joostei]